MKTTNGARNVIAALGLALALAAPAAAQVLQIELDVAGYLCGL